MSCTEDSQQPSTANVQMQGQAPTGTYQLQSNAPSFHPSTRSSTSSVPTPLAVIGPSPDSPGPANISGTGPPVMPNQMSYGVPNAGAYSWYRSAPPGPSANNCAGSAPTPYDFSGAYAYTLPGHPPPPQSNMSGNSRGSGGGRGGYKNKDMQLKRPVSSRFSQYQYAGSRGQQPNEWNSGDHLSRPMIFSPYNAAAGSRGGEYATYQPPWMTDASFDTRAAASSSFLSQTQPLEQDGDMSFGYYTSNIGNQTQPSGFYASHQYNIGLPPAPMPTPQPGYIHPSQIGYAGFDQSSGPPAAAYPAVPQPTLYTTAGIRDCESSMSMGGGNGAVTYPASGSSSSPSYASYNCGPSMLPMPPQPCPQPIIYAGGDYAANLPMGMAYQQDNGFPGYITSTGGAIPALFPAAISPGIPMQQFNQPPPIAGFAPGVSGFSNMFIPPNMEQTQQPTPRFQSSNAFNNNFRGGFRGNGGGARDSRSFKTNTGAKGNTLVGGSDGSKRFNQKFQTTFPNNSQNKVGDNRRKNDEDPTNSRKNLSMHPDVSVIAANLQSTSLANVVDAMDGNEHCSTSLTPLKAHNLQMKQAFEMQKGNSNMDDWNLAVQRMDLEKKIREKLGLIIDNRYQILEKINVGSYGDIFSALDLNDEKRKSLVAVKFGKGLADEAHNHFTYERDAYRSCIYVKGVNMPEEQTHSVPPTLPQTLQDSTKRVVGFPLVYWFGTQYGHSIMVMELLGPSLENMFSFCHNKFKKETIYELGIQMIARVQHLHTRGFVHRDLKPENFLMGLGANENTCYLIDFGLARRYRYRNPEDHSLEHVPLRPRRGTSLVGTARYASLNSHNGLDLSRRDDIESIGYILLEFMLGGNIPWKEVKSSEKEKMRQIQKMKENFDWQRCPWIAAWMAECRQLEFEQEPPYDRFRAILRDYLEDKKYSPEEIKAYITKIRQNQAKEDVRFADPHQHTVASISGASPSSSTARLNHTSASASASSYATAPTELASKGSSVTLVSATSPEKEGKEKEDNANGSPTTQQLTISMSEEAIQQQPAARLSYAAAVTSAKSGGHGNGKTTIDATTIKNGNNNNNNSETASTVQPAAEQTAVPESSREKNSKTTRKLLRKKKTNPEDLGTEDSGDEHKQNDEYLQKQRDLHKVAKKSQEKLSLHKAQEEGKKADEKDIVRPLFQPILPPPTPQNLLNTAGGRLVTIHGSTPGNTPQQMQMELMAKRSCAPGKELLQLVPQGQAATKARDSNADSDWESEMSEGYKKDTAQKQGCGQTGTPLKSPLFNFHAIRDSDEIRPGPTRIGIMKPLRTKDKEHPASSLAQRIHGSPPSSKEMDDDSIEDKEKTRELATQEPHHADGSPLANGHRFCWQLKRNSSPLNKYTYETSYRWTLPHGEEPQMPPDWDKAKSFPANAPQCQDETTEEATIPKDLQMCETEPLESEEEEKSCSPVKNPPKK